MEFESKYDKISDYLFDITKNYLPPAQISELERIILSEVDKYTINPSSTGNLFRVINSLYNKYSFFKDALKYNHHIEILVAICFNSNYLTDIIIRNPEYMYQLFDQAYLESEIESKSLRNEIRLNIDHYSSFKSKVRYLRGIKRRMYLKLGLYDLLELGDLPNVTEQISELAIAISSELFEICYDKICSENGIERPENPFSIISLGKLGGNELNYSSDIDLMFIYEKNITLTGNKNTEFNELFSDAIQLYTQTSNESSNEGFIYRVDLRLRPDGKSAPLARTLHDTVFYYETRGEAWERQMLLKAGILTGSKELFDKFIKRVTPFVFPRSHMASPQYQIKKMRATIEKQTGKNIDIKKSSGGIRDIEFIVQMFQMLFGGKDEKLRSPNTLQTLDYLRQKGHIKEDEAQLLREAYIFFRKIEHYLQLLDNVQTHSIPENTDIKKMLSNYVGIKNVREFDDTLSVTRQKVREIFNTYVSSADDQKESNQVTEKIIFSDIQRAGKNIDFLRSGRGIITSKEFTSGTIELFNEIEPVLNDYLHSSKAPDRTLENFHSFIKYSAYPRIWYKHFKNTLLFVDILKLCEYSQRFVQDLIISQELYEILLEGKIYQKNLEEDFASLSIKEIVFILTCQFALGLVGHDEFSKKLTIYIQYKIDQQCANTFSNYDYLLMGLGSFASEEMVYSSDIDVVLLVDKIDLTSDIQNEAHSFIDKLNRHLHPFKIDFKLRPEGKSSQLVWDYKAYLQYFESRAQLWEFQAINKVKFISGSQVLFSSFSKRLNEIFSEKSFDLQNSIRNMYKVVIKEKADPLQRSIDIKYSHGGLLSVQYMLEYLFLSDKKLYKKGLGESYCSKFQILLDNASTSETSNELKNSYNKLKLIELAYQNLTNSDRTKISLSNKELDGFAYYLKMKDDINIIDYLNRLFAANITLMEDILGKD